MKIDYTNLSFTQLIDKIETNRFFDLPRMAREAFRRLLTRVEALEDAPTPSESFIPLSGTEVGSPVSGNIEINSAKLFTEKSGETFELNFQEKFIGYKALLGNYGISFEPNAEGATKVIDEINNIGLLGEADFSEAYPTNKLIYAQRSYVDARGSAVNETTSPLSESDLNTAYPNAKDGFSIIAPNVVGGGRYYIKAGAGWVYQQIIAVV